MLTGLRKRESYEELINELGDDPIKKYPDRKASQIENSMYMSQLALGFQEVVEQNNRLMKEKTKELILHDMAAEGNVSHRVAQSASNYNSPLESLTSHGLRNHPRPIFLPQQFDIHSSPSVSSKSVKSSSESSISTMNSAKREFKYETFVPVHMDIDDNAGLRDVRNRLFGPDIVPEMFRQSAQAQMEIDDDARIQEERQQQLLAQVKQDFEDMSKNNPFEGVFSGGARSSNYVPEPVKTLVDKIEEKEEKKQTRKPKKFEKPNDEPDDQPEQALGRASSRSKRKTTNEKSDDEVEMTGVNLNKSTDLKFWKSQSPNEIRAQLNLRNLPKKDYAFLDKKHLLEYLRNIIRSNKW